MTLLIPPDFAQILIPLAHADLSRAAAITFGVSTDLGSATAVAHVDKITTDFGSTFGQVLDAGVIYGPALGRFGQDGGEPLSVEGTISATGATQADRMPPNVAALFSKQTNRGGRRGRGRLFMPWVLGDGDVDDVGRITGAKVTQLQGAADDFLGELDTAVAPVPATPMYLLHNSGGSTTPGSPTQVQGLVCQTIVATQRRRIRS